MSGFGSHEIPDWVKDQFSEHTALPHGPLAQLPVPVEGHIVGAQARVPANGSAANWTVSVVCAESVQETMRFYEEFLPLSGYELIGAGSVRNRRPWFSRRQTATTEIIVFRLAQYLGRIIVEADGERTTRVETEMAHCQHHLVRDLVDREELRSRTEIKWRLRP